MLSKKKKIFILVGMVALLAVTGLLNWFLNNNTGNPINAQNDNLSANFFADHRATRELTRQETFDYYDSILASATSSETAKAEAEQAKLQLAAYKEQELVLESLIKALGFSDAVVTNSTQNVNIIVKCNENLTEQEVAQILDIIVTETDKTALNVRVVPYIEAA